MPITDIKQIFCYSCRFSDDEINEYLATDERQLSKSDAYNFIIYKADTNVTVSRYYCDRHGGASCNILYLNCINCCNYYSKFLHMDIGHQYTHINLAKILNAQIEHICNRDNMHLFLDHMTILEQNNSSLTEDKKQDVLLGVQQ